MLEPSLAVDQGEGGVEFTLTVENTGATPVELTFRSGQRAEFVVTADDDTVWRYSDGRMFTQALSQETVAPGETVTASAEWADAEPGEYDLAAWLTAGEQPEATASFTVA